MLEWPRSCRRADTVLPSPRHSSTSQLLLLPWLPSPCRSPLASSHTGHNFCTSFASNKYCSAGCRAHTDIWRTNWELQLDTEKTWERLLSGPSSQNIDPAISNVLGTKLNEMIFHVLDRYLFNKLINFQKKIVDKLSIWKYID